MAPGDDKQSSSGLEFKLHPLVLINISDHYTRFKANAPEGAPPPTVMGCLLGTTDGRTVDVVNSFEMTFSREPDGSWAIDEAFQQKKAEQYKTVFPKQDVVGWYCTGADLEQQHMEVQRKMSETLEGPVFLLLNPLIDHSRKDLPVEVYESELHVLDGVPQTIFVHANYSMETSDAERIGVDQVAKILTSGKATGTEQLTAHLSGLHSAIKMLCGKLVVIKQHMDQIAAGNVSEYPHDLIRQVNSLVSSLPALDNPAFKKEYLLEYNDTLATLLLAGVTQSLNGLSELTDKFGIAFERTTRRGRGGGGMLASMYGM